MPPSQKQVGVFREILEQERTPIFTGISILAALLTFGVMLLTYARWHSQLGFGALAIPYIYGFLALTGAVINTIAAYVAVARGERYGGRIALAAACPCILAAFVFVRLTLR